MVNKKNQVRLFGKAYTTVSETEQRDNFYDSWITKPLRWMFNAMKNDINVHPQFLPFMHDYTHQWTDDDLYKYFNLSEDEIRIIESEIK